MGFFGKLFGKKEKESLDQGLEKTKEGFLGKIARAVAGKSTVDEEVLDNLEEALVSADVGIETSVALIERIQELKGAAADAEASREAIIQLSERLRSLQQIVARRREMAEALK